MLTCKSCSAALDLTMSTCPSCGAEVPLGRLTSILGIVCRHCDAYNDPGAKTCVACGDSLGVAPDEAATGTAVTLSSIASAPPSTETADGQRSEPSVPSVAPPEAARSRGASVAPPEAARSRGASVAAPEAARRLGASVAPPEAARSRGPATASSAAKASAPPPPPAPPGLVEEAARSTGGSPVTARLVVERGEAAPGTTFRLAQDEVQAGRAQGQVVFPDDPCLAPLHATFLVREGSFLLRDEGAAGGVYVRLRGATAPLRPGSLFAIGDRLLRFAGPLPPPPPPPGDGTRRLGAPRPDRPAVIVEEWLEGGVGGRAYLRTGPSITIGRSGCSINLGDDPYLSQAHAEIVIEPDGTAKLRDLGSSNGTFVRIPPGSERELHDGDAVRLGREVLRVEVGGIQER